MHQELLSVFHVLAHLYSQQPNERGAIIPTLQMSLLRFKKVRILVQGQKFFSIVSIRYSTDTVKLFLYTPAQNELFFILFINN